MTDQTTPSKPKSSIAKKFFLAVGIIFALLGIDHFTYNFVSGGAEVEVTVTDSTISVTAADTSSATIAPVDTAKKDTAK